MLSAIPPSLSRRAGEVGAYADRENPMSSSITAPGPTGTLPALAWWRLWKTILSRDTLRRKSANTSIIHLLARAAPIAKAERRESGIVADRCRLPSVTANTVPKPLLVMPVLRPSLTGSVVISNGQRGRPICLHFASSISALVGTLKIAFRLEALGLVPEPRVEARVGVGRIHVRVSLVRHAELREGRAAVEG